jgi:fermentation-respiration switch protein FrsA (DUF1100 family)
VRGDGQRVLGGDGLAPPIVRRAVLGGRALGVPRYREGTMERIVAPILVCLAEHDIEVSAAFVKAKVAKARRADVRIYPGGHFDLYHDDTFEQVVDDQTKFLRAHLLR